MFTPNQVLRPFGAGRRWLLVGLVCGAALLARPWVPEWSLGDLARRLDATVRQQAWLYWLPSLLALSALLVAVYGPLFRPPAEAPKRLWHSRTLFVTLTALAVVLGRWPTLALIEMNPDEGFELAGALTLLQDPRYWKSFDGTTHGPLVELALSLPAVLGMVPEYGAARLVGLGLSLGTLFCLFGTLQGFFSEEVSRAAITPLTCWVALIRHCDFIAFNAEYPSLFLLALGGYCCARLGRHPGKALAFACGFVLGLVPFAKLQVAPMGLPLAALAYLGVARAAERGGRLPALLALTAGGLTPTALVLLYLWEEGLTSHFLTSYLLANLTYAQGNDAKGPQLWGHFGWLLTCAPLLWLRPALVVLGAVPFVLLQTSSRSSAFLWGVSGPVLGGFLVLCCLPWASSRAVLLPAAAVPLGLGLGFCSLLLLPLVSGRRAAALGSYLVLAVGTLAVLRPGRMSDHYLLLLVFPLWFLVAIVLALLLERCRPLPGWSAALAVLLFVASLVPFWENSWIMSEYFGYAFQRDVAGERVASLIGRYGGRGQMLAVWGWVNRCYVLTGMPCATLTPDTRLQLEPGPYQGYFKDLFLEYLERNRPVVFADAVGPLSNDFVDRRLYGYEQFPALRARIEADYRQVGEVEGVRVFVRKDRLAALSGEGR